MGARQVVALVLACALMLPLQAWAADQGELLQKIEALSKELERMKQQLYELQKKEEVKEQRITAVEQKAESSSSVASWLEIGGDYRFRYDYLKANIQNHYSFEAFQREARKVWSRAQLENHLSFNNQFNVPQLQNNSQPYYNVNGLAGSGQTRSFNVKNDSLLTNRFGLNFKVKATEDVQIKARLLMYKAFGNDFVDQNQYFADKFVAMDGNSGHIPSDNTLLVDQAYATWSNIGGVPLWFSVGRRPSTGGVPTNIRQNAEKSGTAGVPGLLVDYAFDGGTIGFAPDIDMLPGFYVKACYGKGIDTGFSRSIDASRFKDTQFIGINLVPYDTDNLHIELQWQKGMDIFAYPGNTDPFGLGATNRNIGNITWWGAVVMGKINKLGPGDLNLFVTGAMSKTHPNDNTYAGNFYSFHPNFFNGGDNGTLLFLQNQPIAGLMWDANNPASKRSRTGSAIYLGARYDIKSTGTKLGAEYNQGSKYWMAFTPASDDMLTSKLATRGSVYELYLIQQLNKKPIAKKGNAFVRLGWQHYDYKYTGSGFWLGEPKKIADLTVNDLQMLAPVKKADNVYFTFDVVF